MKSRLLPLVLMISGGLAAAQPIPDDFPRFEVPGHEKEMESLRAFHWSFYTTAGPKATLWDDWLSGPALWPAVSTDGYSDRMRREWRDTLSARIIEPDGYVATHQHGSIAHQHGWPFPGWHQGLGGYGWHFSHKDMPGPGWAPKDLSKQEGWEIVGASDDGISDDGWNLTLTAAGASVTAPVPRRDPNDAIEARQSPFLQIRWKARGLGDAQPYVDWLTEEDLKAGRKFDDPDQGAAGAQRFHFDPVDSDSTFYAMLPLYKHPAWKGQIKRLRIHFGNAAPGAKVTIHSIFSQYDTRHTINGPNFVRGCANYFWWTRDLNFLRGQINRMRTAVRFVMSEQGARDENVVHDRWVGHEGRSGIRRGRGGEKTLLPGEGIGSNYWDLLPFGGRDCYATVHYYDAVRALERIEREIDANPGWNIPGGPLRLEPEKLARHADSVKATGNTMFWSDRTGRFVAAVDEDGKTHDYGFTFLNLEAVALDFADDAHAQSIMDWITGARTIESDTAQGPEIYHWRFAPRATTRRNIDYYGWFWSGPESVPWGGQVQDGGAVLGFSYYDLMARLRVLGPDNAWQRLREIIEWIDEVKAAGGSRKYYDGSREGSLQGCGTPGGLGIDCEFFESVLLPQVMLRGFLGFRPAGDDAFHAEPKLPKEWPSLKIGPIRYHHQTVNVTAKSNETLFEVVGPNGANK